MGLKSLLIRAGLIVALLAAYFAGGISFASQPGKVLATEQTLLHRCMKLTADDALYEHICSADAVHAIVVSEAVLNLTDEDFDAYLQAEDYRRATYGSNVIAQSEGTTFVIAETLAAVAD